MRRTFLRGLVLNAAGNGTVAAAALIRNVLVARVMGPLAFGLWQIGLVALRLAGELHLGALHALALDAPVLRGSGKEAEARLLEARALGIAMAFSAVGGWAAAAILRLEGGPALGLSSLLLAASVFAQQVLQAHAVLFQTRRQFGRMALLQFTFAVVHLAGLLILLPARYITGALLSWCAGAVAAVGLLRWISKDPVPVPRIPPASVLAGTLRRGLPTYLVGAAFVLFLQVDRIVVGGLLGREALGQYGVLALGGSALLFLPDVLAGVLWPFAGEEFGRSGRSPGALAPLAVSALRGTAAVLAAGFVLVAQGTEVLVTHVLPGYWPSLDLLRLYLPGVFLLGLVHPLRILLVTAGGDHDLLRLLAGAVVLAAAGEGAVAASGGGLAGVALAGTLCAAVLLATGLGLARTRLALGTGAARLGIECGCLLALALLGDAALERWGPSLRTLPGVAVRIGIPALGLLGAGVGALRIGKRLPGAPAEERA